MRTDKQRIAKYRAKTDPATVRLKVAAMLDAMGRRVTSAKAGVYFVRDEGRGAGDLGRTRKVVVQR